MPIDPLTGERLPYQGDPGAPPGAPPPPDFASALGAGAGQPDPASFGALDPLGQLASGGAGQRPGMVLAALLQVIEQREGQATQMMALAQQIMSENQDVGLVAQQIMAALAGPLPETLDVPAGTEAAAQVPPEGLL